MHEIITLLEWTWKPALYALLGFTAGTATVAVISPQLFARVSSMTNRGCSFAAIVAILERPVDLDRFLLPYSRWIGATALVVVCLVGWLVVPFIV